MDIYKEIVYIYSLFRYNKEVMAGELVEFEEGTIDIALNLESNNVGVVLMDDSLMIQEGSSVKATGRIAHIPVSEAYLGRYVPQKIQFVRIIPPTNEEILALILISDR